MQGSRKEEGGLIETTSHPPTDRPTDQPPQAPHPQTLTPSPTHLPRLPHRPNRLIAKQIAKTFGLSG